MPVGGREDPVPRALSFGKVGSQEPNVVSAGLDGIRCFEVF